MVLTNAATRAWSSVFGSARPIPEWPAPVRDSIKQPFLSGGSRRTGDDQSQTFPSRRREGGEYRLSIRIVVTVAAPPHAADERIGCCWHDGRPASVAEAEWLRGRVHTKSPPPCPRWQQCESPRGKRISNMVFAQRKCGRECVIQHSVSCVKVLMRRRSLVGFPTLGAPAKTAPPCLSGSL